jgi:hypothetical protein
MNKLVRILFPSFAVTAILAQITIAATPEKTTMTQAEEKMFTMSTGYLYCVKKYGILPTSSYIPGDLSWQVDWKRALKATPRR